MEEKVEQLRKIAQDLVDNYNVWNINVFIDEYDIVLVDCDVLGD